MSGYVPVGISIHASAKEATFCYDTNEQSAIISIHASAKEATFLLFVMLFQMFYFNPRLREGGDINRYGIFQKEYNFNPRLREGGDGCTERVKNERKDFNPRLREGGDRVSFDWL